MAKQASRENARSGPSEVQFKSALNVMRTDIDRAKRAQSKAGGDANAAWKRIEGMGLNKAGAKFMGSIIGQEPAVAKDILRTVIGLATAEGLLDKDLVDQAEDGGKGSAEAAPKDDGELKPFVPTEPKAKRPSKPKASAKPAAAPLSGPEALAKARRTMGNGKVVPIKSELPKGAPGDTDLAGDDEDSANEFLSQTKVAPIPGALSPPVTH